MAANENTCDKRCNQKAEEIAQKASWEAEKAARQTRRFAKNAKKSSKEWYAQPKTRVGVVKFENESGKILYEARYTSCSSEKMHAENLEGHTFGRSISWYYD